MKVHWRKIAYATFWILLLGVTLESFAHPDADNETRAVMLAFIALLAAPISIIPLCIISAVGWQTAMEPLADNRPVQFLLWWLLMFAMSYWQWFHLVPRLTAKFPGTPDA